MSDFDEITVYSSIRSTQGFYPFNSSLLTINLFHYKSLSFSEILSPNQV